MGRSRTVNCQRCGRETSFDEISDHGYLQEQYGWEFMPIRCPMCVHGTKVGARLLDQMEEIRRGRLRSKIDKRTDDA